MALGDVLQGVLDGLSIQPTGPTTPEPGELVGAEIVPPLEAVDVADLQSGEVTLTWLTKDVLFSDEDLVDGDLTAAAVNAITEGGRPEVTSTGSLVNLPGVPGLVGQLSGQLPLSSVTTVPVQATFAWRVLGEEGEAELPADEYRMPGGGSGASVQVAFAPETVELTSSGTLPAPRRRFLAATVSLQAGGISVGPRDLPPLPVLVPALPIPTVLALFIHSNFQPRSGDDPGGALVVVPASSPLRNLTQLNSKLSSLQAVLGNLSGLASFAAFALGVGDLASALTAQPGANVQFRATDRIDNLNGITLIQNPWYKNDIEAEDELSSLILIGRSGRGARCFIHRKRKGGRFLAATGAAMVAIVRTLHSSSPTAEQGTLTVEQSASTFGDELSSLEFV